MFHSIHLGVFNLRTGFGITEGYYEDFDQDSIPVFNDIYHGFYTIEFDIFTYPGILINFTDSFALGVAGGGGVRLPLLTKIDDEGNVSDICVGTGVMPSLVFYYNRPVRNNIAMGEGPVLRAGVEMLNMKRYYEAPARTKYDKIQSGNY